MATEDTNEHATCILMSERSYSLDLHDAGPESRILGRLFTSVIHVHACSQIYDRAAADLLDE